MNWKGVIKTTTYCLDDMVENLGLNFYQKPQTYKTVFEIKIKNLSNEAKSIRLVLPIPSNRPNQRMLVEPNFSIAPNEIKNDRKFDNQYGVWQLNLVADEEKILMENFTIKILPQTNKNFNKFLLDEYKKDVLDKSSLGTDNYISPDDEKIKTIVKKLGVEQNVGIILNKTNRYVIENLKYGKPIAGLYSYNEALEKDAVDCGGFSTLFASLARAYGIPARIVSGFWAGYKINKMHAWTEIQLPNGEWLVADPSIEKLRQEKRTKKFGQLGAIGSDRIIFSHGSDIPIVVNGQKYKIPILQNPHIIKTEDNSSLQIEVNLKTERL